MAIRFTAEGGFYEVPDPPPPPKRKYFSHPICDGPSSKRELFDAVKLYPARRIIFGIAQPVDPGCPLGLAFTCSLEVAVYGIRALLVPMEHGDPMTIDVIKDHWLGDGFVQTSDGFKCLSFCYDVKKRTGTLSIMIIE